MIDMSERLVEEKNRPKFKVGDKVRIKTLDWYNENKNEYGDIPCGDEYDFISQMTVFCGKILTIDVDFENETYLMKEDNNGFVFTDEMIECKVEEKSSIDLTVKGEEIKERIEITIPEGYEYVIESGKIIFTKKKKEYPKTYEECCQYLGCDDRIPLKIIGEFTRLINARNAYWKIAGEEMGLEKPWEPDWNNISDKYCIYFVSGDVWSKECQTRQCPFAFPTSEMRDAFKENFKEEIEICKELL